MFPSQKKIELFARVSTVGWDSIGNEIDGKNIDASLKELL
jgi:N6-adenosine-specific RNA methylase IME4